MHMHGVEGRVDKAALVFEQVEVPCGSMATE